MNDRQSGYRIGGAGVPGGSGAGGPGAFLARVVGAIAAVGFFLLALFLGAFVFVALLIAAAVGTIVFRVWLWWQTRKLGREYGGAGDGSTQGTGRSGSGPRGTSGRRPGGTGGSSGGTVVDAEYEVLSDEDREGPGSRSAEEREGDAATGAGSGSSERNRPDRSRAGDSER